MMSLRNLLLLIVVFCLVNAGAAGAAPARIMKVIPLFVDEEGRHALSPSLYERDAYQVLLAKHPERQAGMRYTVRWKLTRNQPGIHTLRLELRGAKSYRVAPYTIELPIKKSGWYGRWAHFEIDPVVFHDLGSVIAWRASLNADGQCLAEQKSFLW